MQWSESEHDWLSKVVMSNPRIREVARDAIASSKFAISARYRRFVVEHVLTQNERAELCKMVWDRFKVTISGREAIFTMIVRTKLPSSLYSRFQEYMSKFGIVLIQKKIGNVRAYVVDVPLSRGKRFIWFCKLNRKLAARYNVDFCDVSFNRAYFLVLDAYAQNFVGFDYVEKAFEHLVKGEHYMVIAMAKALGDDRKGTLITGWAWEGKITKVGRGMYKIHCEAYHNAIKEKNNEVQVSSEGS
jgi:hypothetical protein